jgi:capsular exopolysaccharide synthesis family protein
MADTLQSPPEQDAAASRFDRELNVAALLSVLYRRRWVSIFAFAIAATAVAAYTLSVTRIYEARSQLVLVDRASLGLPGGGSSTDRGYLETQQRLLRSRSLMRSVITELELWDEGAITSPGASVVGRWWGRGATQPQDGSAPPEPAAPGETAAESAVIDRALSQLRVLPVDDTRIIEVRFESPDPARAAAVVNTLTKIYIAQDQEFRSQASKEAAARLAEQVAEQRRKVEASELALQTYRERENSLSLDAGPNIVVQRLNALNSAVTQAKTDVINAEARYRLLTASQQDPEALNTLEPIRSNSLVQQIRERLTNLQRERAQLSGSLGAKHPDMVQIDGAIAMAQRELTAEVTRAVESVRQEVVAARARERELTAALNTQKSSALALNRQGIEYGVLLREVESDRQIYQSLLQRANEMAVASGVKAASIEVVDPAPVPRRPVRPDTTRTLFIGLLLSAVLGIGMAFIWEAFDTRIQTAADLKAALGLPFLGMLPYVTPRALKGKSLVLTQGVPAAYAEACRSLRTNVLASAGSTGGRSLLVTSASPGDGKSMVATNLALVLGRSGSRVLIIDADLRRPMLHQLLNHAQQPGLADVLTGACKPSEAIVPTRSSNVWLLPSGSSVPNPSEQLGSSRFRAFVAKLGESFDWVIIDSPPIMAVTDPAVIAQLTSGVLFVVNARHTSRQVAQNALDRLETAGASFAGAVLNAVTLDRDHHYHARYYLPAYGEAQARKRSA